MTTTPWQIFSAAVVGALVLVWVVQTVIWPTIPGSIVVTSYAVIVMSSSLGSSALRAHLLAKRRIDESAGLEHGLSVSARAGGFNDLALGCLGLGAIFLVSGNSVAGLGCVVLVIISMIIVETRAALLRRRQPATR
ncbi:hypothetical protein HOW07_16705 [Plantibacter sp. MCCC 1A11337]|uniref:hypothetical protein n=1 Tax=Plantibacter sp. MCCC 1A11337 TaxID=2736644 RepID=UPI001582ACF1|nr:hypothetical protein [Plantibacter sp. MCCC 1A11337]NUJ89657.1 hypothetical protein [Plantibacter sp. MCCC 1A11337]